MENQQLSPFVVIPARNIPISLDDDNETSSPEPPARQLRKRLPIQQAPYSIERIRARKAGIPTEVDSKVLKLQREQTFSERYNYEEQDDGFVVHDSDENPFGNTFDEPEMDEEISSHESPGPENSSVGSFNETDKHSAQYVPSPPITRCLHENKKSTRLETPLSSVDDLLFNKYMPLYSNHESSESDSSSVESFNEMENYSIQSISSPLITRCLHENKKDTPFDRLLRTNLQWAKETPVPSIDDPLFKKYTPL
ncbi:13411_t:CDS:1, partial [Racocetra fulgida]